MRGEQFKSITGSVNRTKLSRNVGRVAMLKSRSSFPIGLDPRAGRAAGDEKALARRRLLASARAAMRCSFPYGWGISFATGPHSGFPQPKPFGDDHRIITDAWKTQLRDAMERDGPGWVFYARDVYEWR